jgi:hypothetical protein
MGIPDVKCHMVKMDLKEVRHGLNVKVILYIYNNTCSNLYHPDMAKIHYLETFPLSSNYILFVTSRESKDIHLLILWMWQTVASPYGEFCFFDSKPFKFLDMT